MQLPAELIEDRRRLHREYETTQRALRSLNAASAPAQVDELLGRLRDLRQERIALVEQLGELSPRLAALEKPEILDLSSARQHLDPGTVLLSYGVTKSQTLIFVLARAESLSVIRQPIGRRALEERIKRLRRLANLAENPRASLLLDHYDEDWSQLRYVIVDGSAEVTSEAAELEYVVELLVVSTRSTSGSRRWRRTGAWRSSSCPNGSLPGGRAPSPETPRRRTASRPATPRATRRAYTPEAQSRSAPLAAPRSAPQHHREARR